MFYWSSFTPCAKQANPCCLQKYLKEEIQFSLFLELNNEGFTFHGDLLVQQKVAKIAAMLENSERSVRGVRMGKSGPLKCAESRI